MDNLSSYTTEQGRVDFVIRFLGNLAGDCLGQIINKFDSKAVTSGLMEIQ